MIIHKKHYFNNSFIAYLPFLTALVVFTVIWLATLLSRQKIYTFINTTSNKKLHHLHIDLSFKNAKKIEYQRYQALTHHRVSNSLIFFNVSGKIYFDNAGYDCNIRLKGDRSIHISDQKKWSFRVRIKGDNTILGMRIFSLHRPVARNHTYEWLFHKILGKEDILNLKYDFVYLTYRNKILGIYAIEEHFDKYLIERNQFREGPIVRFEENYLRRNSIEFTTVVPYVKKKWTNEQNYDLTLNAISKLDQYRRGSITTDQTFDTERLAKFFAIADVFGYRHSTVWKSLRFYYNPITTKFSPVGYDAHHGPPDTSFLTSAEFIDSPNLNWITKKYRDFNEKLFRDKTSTFYKNYINYLDIYSRKRWLDQTLLTLRSELEIKHSVLNLLSTPPKDHVFHIGPQRFIFSTSPFYKRAQRIQREFLLFGRE